MGWWCSGCKVGVLSGSAPCPKCGKLRGSSAVFSECGKYRYILTRNLKDLPKVKPALFIMLNPSTADAVENDPTIRRCMGFAEREGCTRLTVVNLFALRSTDPKTLRTAEDPEGPDNDFHIEEQVRIHKLGLVVAAWGSDSSAKRRAEYVMNRIGSVQCLGKTKRGSPKHPLYLSNQTVLEPYP